MLWNVLDVDMAAHKVAVRSKSGAILLFDFAFAFLSLSHDMMWDMLVVLGIDRSCIEIVHMFHQNNRHLLNLHSSLFDGVEVRSGLRQGCPSSGLFFAICIDVLLGRIEALLHRNEAIGAFADDIAVVVENVWTSATSLQTLFNEF